MEILKRGTPPAERTYTIKCGVCDTDFRCKQRELITVWHRNEETTSVNCPVCTAMCFTQLASYDNLYDPYPYKEKQ